MSMITWKQKLESSFLALHATQFDVMIKPIQTV